MTVVLTIIYHDDVIMVADRATTAGVHTNGTPVIGPDERKMFVNTSTSVIAMAGQKTLLLDSGELDLFKVARNAAAGRDPLSAASEIARRFADHAEDARQTLPTDTAAVLEEFDRPVFSAVVIAGHHLGSPEIAAAGMTLEGPCEAQNLTLREQFVLAPNSVFTQLEEVCRTARLAPTAIAAAKVPSG